MTARALLLVSAAALAPLAARGAVLEVGPGRPYATPCQAIAAAADGDTVEIDASGSYAGDVCAFSQSRLTLRGVGGRAHIDAAGQVAQGKAIWVVAGDDTTVEGIDLSGAAAPSGAGAGIRQEGRNLTVRGCFFHDNENGLLAVDRADSEILIERTELARNGKGDGLSHNLDVGNVARLTVRFSYSHHAKRGHLVRSRAATSTLLYNRLTDEAGGAAIFELDLPNGGTSYVLGNVIEQGAATVNSTMLSYREEGGAAGNPGSDLYVVNNTFVNHRAQGGQFVQVGVGVTTPVVLKNNVFAGGGTVTNQSNATLAGNWVGADPGFVAPGSHDYRPAEGSPCVDTGVDPGASASYVNLAPQFQYLHPADGEPRPVVGAAIDVGAFEWGVPVGPPDAGPVDAGSDAGEPASADGGGFGLSEARRPGAEGGCGCSAPAGAPPAIAAMLLGAALRPRQRRLRCL